jgi:starvation-inducible DNA-binding protein
MKTPSVALHGSNAKSAVIDILNARLADAIVAQLDGIALGTSQIVAKATKLAPYPTDIRKTSDHLAALAERFATLANQVREDIDATDEAGDADAADILTAFSRELDKDLWFIKSHLE